MARALGISKDNDFALLDALGGDVAGALTLWPEGKSPPAHGGTIAQDPLGDNALVELLDTLPERPFLAGREGLRLSLAGAQSKLPVVLVDGHIALPAPGQPTTHILKPELKRFAAATENEAFVMRLARGCGLDVAEARPHRVNGRRFLLVTRYDRTTDETGRVRRLHQEDFCQALGIAPERKYAAEGGPTFKTSFALLREAANSACGRDLKLLDAALFNLVAGNADAHGKNFSLLYAGAQARLAPLYDLMCTAAYPEITTRPAMKIADAAELKDFSTRTWEKFASDIQLGLPFLRRRVRELANAAQEKAGTIARGIAAQGFDAEALDRYAAIVQSRAKIIAASV